MAQSWCDVFTLLLPDESRWEKCAISTSAEHERNVIHQLRRRSNCLPRRHNRQLQASNIDADFICIVAAF
jgi:hypothetical protein